MAQGKVKLKENGLQDGHPEKEGVLVNVSDLVSEIRQRLKRKADLDLLTREAEGLRLVGGIRGEATSARPAAETETSTESIKETSAVPPTA
jgi:histidyl-tRNA synthetase